MNIFEELPEKETYYYYAFTNHDIRSYRNCTHEVPVYRSKVDYNYTTLEVLMEFLKEEQDKIAGIIYTKSVSLLHQLSYIDIEFSLKDITLVTCDDYRTGQDLKFENFISFANRTNLKYEQ